MNRVINWYVCVFFDKRGCFGKVVVREWWFGIGFFEKIGMVVDFLELYDEIY